MRLGAWLLHQDVDLHSAAIFSSVLGKVSVTSMPLNRGMDSIVAKAGTLSTLENIKGIISFERKFKRAIDTTPFGCYPSMLLDVYEGTVGWSETDINFVEKGWRHVQSGADVIDENVVEPPSRALGEPERAF